MEKRTGREESHDDGPNGGIWASKGRLIIEGRDDLQEEIEFFMSSAQALAVLMKDDAAGSKRVAQYATFLLSDPHYDDLAGFLEWYGRRYLLKPIQDVLLEIPAISREGAVEFGPGTGWLINDVHHLFKTTWAVDKRGELWDAYNYADILFRKDVEKEPIDIDTSITVGIGNHFLHCLDDPELFIFRYRLPYWLIVEPTEEDYGTQFPYWHDQLELFGAKPLRAGEVFMIFDSQGYEHIGGKDVSGQEISLWKRK
jgi:hypothetical protein